MTTFLLILAAWFALAIVGGFLFGAVIRRGDSQPRPSMRSSVARDEAA